MDREGHSRQRSLGASRFEDEPVFEWRADSPNLKRNAACVSCNTGWMSDLENRAKPLLEPLIRGTASRLEVHDLDLVSFWALKTVLMLDRCTEARRQSIPDSEYKPLYHLRAPAPSAHVWLGKCEVSRGSFFRARTVELDTGDSKTHGWATTLAVGTW